MHFGANLIKLLKFSDFKIAFMVSLILTCTEIFLPTKVVSLLQFLLVCTSVRWFYMLQLFYHLFFILVPREGCAS